MIKKEELKEKLNNAKEKVTLPAAMIAGVIIGVAVENWNNKGRANKRAFGVA